jgi:hypothetical protein
MKKLLPTLTAIALVSSALGAAGIATPSLAYGSIGECTSPGDHDSDWNFDMMAGELNANGIDYESIAKFGNCFLVREKNPDGSVTLQFYDPLTLNRVK